MKLPAAFILAVATALAQTSQESQIVNRLTTDLGVLRSLAGPETLLDPSQLAASDRAALRANLESQSPRQSAAMSAVVGDLQDRYGEPVLSWDSTYVLTGALAGRVLENDSLAMFTRAFVKSLDDTFACSRMHMPARRCKQFQDSVEQMYATLLPLGVSSTDAQIVVENLIRNSDRLTSQIGRLVQPIPPARPAPPIRP